MNPTALVDRIVSTWCRTVLHAWHYINRAIGVPHSNSEWLQELDMGLGGGRGMFIDRGTFHSLLAAVGYRLSA